MCLTTVQIGKCPLCHLAQQLDLLRINIIRPTADVITINSLFFREPSNNVKSLSLSRGKSARENPKRALAVPPYFAIEVENALIHTIVDHSRLFITVASPEKH